MGPPSARVYIKAGLIETASRTTSAAGPKPIVPVPDGVSADSASVLAARESERQPPRPTQHKRLRCEEGAVDATCPLLHLMIVYAFTRFLRGLMTGS